jgi:hypothetical protein
MHEKETSMNDIECALLKGKVLRDIQDLEIDVLGQQDTDTAILE